MLTSSGRVCNYQKGISSKQKLLLWQYSLTYYILSMKSSRSFSYSFLVPFLHSLLSLALSGSQLSKMYGKKHLVPSLQVIYCPVIVAHNGTSSVSTNKNQKPAILNSDLLIVLKRVKKSKNYNCGIRVEKTLRVYAISNNHLQLQTSVYHSLITGLCMNRIDREIASFHLCKINIPEFLRVLSYKPSHINTVVKLVYQEKKTDSLKSKKIC